MRIIVADAHALFRKGLQSLISKLTPRNSDVIEAASLLDLTRSLTVVARESRVGLVVVAIELLADDGAKQLRRVLRRIGGAPLLITSNSANQTSERMARHLGAIAYVPKTASVEDILDAVKSALSGREWFAEDLADPDRNGVTLDLAARDRPAVSAEEERLTPRQREVLQFLSQGLSNRQIAEALGLSEGTIKAHVTAILRGLGVSNRTQAVLLHSRRMEESGE